MRLSLVCASPNGCAMPTTSSTCSKNANKRCTREATLLTRRNLRSITQSTNRLTKINTAKAIQLIRIS